MSGIKKSQTEPLVTQLESYSFDDLKDKKEIVFTGAMELGWEVSRWAPPINYFIKNNPDKKIIIAALEDRIDLYKGYHGFYPIKIDGIYTRKRPCMYSIYNLDEGEQEGIVNNIKNLYPRAYIKKAPPNKLGSNVFDLNKMDFDFQPRAQNKFVIEKLLSNHLNKPVVTLSPRYRTDREDVAKRNWGYWHELYEMLSDFVVFVAGVNGGYTRPDKKLINCICLEDYNRVDTSTIGLTIEAMRASKLTIGQQSGNPILSLYLGIPVVSWGHEKERHTIRENPLLTYCNFTYSPEYDVKPEVIYKAILDDINKKHMDKKVVVGAGGTQYKGWYSTNKDLLDITNEKSFDKFGKISNFLAEHVWEHLSAEDGLKATKNCFKALNSGGRLRIAVPDGYKPDPQYIDWVRVGGGGKAGNDHRILYSYKSLTKMLTSVGFKVELLEYWDEHKQFHFKEWFSEDGHIGRSMKHDWRNKDKPLTYTSLIVDAIKP